MGESKIKQKLQLLAKSQHTRNIVGLVCNFSVSHSVCNLFNERVIIILGKLTTAVGIMSELRRRIILRGLTGWVPSWQRLTILGY